MSKFFTEVFRTYLPSTILFGTSVYSIAIIQDIVTKRLIKSTRDCMDHPEVKEEVENLFKDLLQRMLDDPETKEELILFFNEVMGTEIMESSIKDLTLKVLDSPDTKEIALSVMKRVVQFVMKDRMLNDESHKISHEALGLMFSADKMIKEPKVLALVRNIKKIPNIGLTNNFQKIINEEKPHIEEEMLIRDLHYFPYHETFRYPKSIAKNNVKIKPMTGFLMKKSVEIFNETYKKAKFIYKSTQTPEKNQPFIPLDNIEGNYITY
ncbi:unnamed protein product [Blepharisma stoltei]|uniref:Vitellogenin n=1 Tax=Blepharisma stoltei TaxID=1481888 RepID=A0AAU9K6S7_9CILI|nr:unnamed protein product [Blepharisma stoltei]